MSSSKRPRRKAKQARAQQTVEVVLEGAARVLSEHGYASATTNRMAQAAGVSVGTVYEYFAKKDDVFEALIARELDALVAAIREVETPPAAAIDEKLARLIAAAMGAMRYGPEMLRALNQVPGAKFRTRLSDARSVVIAHVRELLEQSRGELAVRDLDLAAFVVVSAAEGVGANATSEQFDARLVEELRALVRAYLLGPRSPTADRSADR